ncbi:MAG: hypothetical protein WCL23_05935, partial [Candidatus Moraniibacteriota bacterium]
MRRKRISIRIAVRDFFARFSAVLKTVYHGADGYRLRFLTVAKNVVTRRFECFPELGRKRRRLIRKLYSRNGMAASMLDVFSRGFASVAVLGNVFQKVVPGSGALANRITTLVSDHVALFLKAPEDNVRMIKKRIPKRKKGLVFRSFSEMRAYRKKSSAMLGFVMIAFLFIGFQIFGISGIKGATFGWVQIDWSGGADTNAKANHGSDQSSWSKFFSKDVNVDTSGG